MPDSVQGTLGESKNGSYHSGRGSRHVGEKRGQLGSWRRSASPSSLNRFDGLFSQEVIANAGHCRPTP